MTTVASKVPFYSLCSLLDKISGKTGNDNKKKLLKDFVDEWRSYHNKIHENDPNTVRKKNYNLIPQSQIHRSLERCANDVRKGRLTCAHSNHGVMNSRRYHHC